jgi:hypothetical protein
MPESSTFNLCVGRGSLRAWLARYRSAPPLRLISRLIVDGARPSAAAIERIEWPATSARDTSSRSAKVKARTDRRRVGGRIPSVAARIPRTDEWCRSNSLAIWCSDSPFCQRSHIRPFWASVYWIRVLRFNRNTPAAGAASHVLHRSYETAADSGPIG